jgi:hypothetical protein
VIRDTEIDGLDETGDRICLGTVAISATRLNVHGCSKGIWASSGTSVLDSYVHDQAGGGTGVGNQPILVDGGTNITLSHNFVRAARQALTNAAIAIFQDYGGASHVTVEQSFLSGGAVVDLIAGGARGSYITVQGNALARSDVGYASDFDATPSKGNSWSSNYDPDTRVGVGPP